MMKQELILDCYWNFQLLENFFNHSEHRIMHLKTKKDKEMGDLLRNMGWLIEVRICLSLKKEYVCLVRKERK